MRVVFLGPPDSPTLAYLRDAQGEEVFQTEEPPDLAWLEDVAPDWIVSHGYRHIVRAPVLERFPDRIVNLHISLLPWNRGADPNLWSWLDDTPKGVSVHLMDSGVDTGDLLAQLEVHFTGEETLASSYAALQDAVVALFGERWPAIRTQRAARRPQRGAGSVHRVADREAVDHLLFAGWDTPVSALRGRSRSARG